MPNAQSHETSRPGEDVFAKLRRDHAHVLARLDPFGSSAERIAAESDVRAEDEAVLRAFATHLTAQFDSHMRAEDEVLYPALERAVPATRGSLRPLRAEHEELRRMLEALIGTLDQTPNAMRNEQVGVQAQDLADLLRIHIRKEEAIVLSVAERLLQPREVAALAAQLHDPGPTHGPVHPADRSWKGCQP